MKDPNFLRIALLGGVCLLATPAFAENFDVPSGDLYAALKVYSAQSGI